MHFTTSFLAYVAPILLLGSSASAFQLQDRHNGVAGKPFISLKPRGTKSKL